MPETIIHIEGRLESGSIAAFQRRLSEASVLGTERLLLDLSHITFIGSAALRVILVAAKNLGASGGKVAIFAPPAIAEVFVVSGLDGVLAVHTQLEQARKALAG